ncbi:disease resistance protein RPV1-like [Macadamia integrifolia]|uniref:disease resistance protein RPV1-like n=1 Tax=Macadamia integrifolia TaxID=60698 RepID=UPI001C4EDBED|nr:disease resistance protein RPV1-like [Macadamia integrifolia]
MKDALRAAGDKSGWVFNDGGDQSKLVEEVAQNAWIRLNIVALIGVKHPVGLASRIESVLSLLKTSSNDVQFLGICGSGGIGKTTIAMGVYNCIFKDFSKSCFLECTREQASQPNGIVSLQEKLLYSIFQVEIKICSSKEGSRMIKERLGRMDILLILDDVGYCSQLDALIGDPNWLGLGSRVIITTRDQSILSGIPENNRKIYEPKELNEKESLQLFSSYAFTMDQPPDDYMQLSVDIVHTTGGLPLALQVLGSDLSINKDKKVWKSMHQILERIPHADVYKKLKISYDNLQDDIEKAMFLDAACFFIGWEEETVISIWEACGFEPRYRMEVLTRKSLLKINKSKYLWMHDQIQDMGRRIAYNESPMEPGKHSRIWAQDDIIKVLGGAKGNEIVEGLLHSFSSNDHIVLHTKGFEKMPKLRLLQVDGAALEGSFQCLPSGLRWLRWWKCPMEKLPTNIYHDELVVLDLRYGLFKHAWNNSTEDKLFQQLKILNLGCCWSLSKSPDFSGIPCLERLNLDNCGNLVNLHESIGQLKRLVYLDLRCCYSLKKLPSSIGRLSSLQKLILTHCISLNELPESIGDLKESLVELSLDKTNIKALPNSVGLLKKLEVLDLSLCHGLVDLPSTLENMTSLRCIDLSGRDKLRYIPKLPTSLIDLRALCKSLVCLPAMEDLKNLKKLYLGDFCIKAGQLSGFVSKDLNQYREVDHFVITNHLFPTHSQEKFLSDVHYARVWKPSMGEECSSLPIDNTLVGSTRTRYLIPPYKICSRLIMHIPLYFTVNNDDMVDKNSIGLNITLRFTACIYSRDQRTTYCETKLRIEDIKLRDPYIVYGKEEKAKNVHLSIQKKGWEGQFNSPVSRDRSFLYSLVYLHEFEGFDWFGFPLEDKFAIEISEVHKDLAQEYDNGLNCTVRQLNFLLPKMSGE